MATRLITLFEALNKLGTTIVVATHDTALLGKVSGARTMRLEGGRLAPIEGEDGVSALSSPHRPAPRYPGSA